MYLPSLPRGCIHVVGIRGVPSINNIRRVSNVTTADSVVCIFFLFLSTSYAVEFRHSKTAHFDGTFFRLDSSGPSSCRQSSRFYSFCYVPRGGWCEEYSCTAAGEIGWQLCASRCLCEQWLDEPSSQRIGGYGLSRKPPKLRSWSCAHSAESRAKAIAAQPLLAA